MTQAGEPSQRSRLDPAVRKSLILDATAKLVAQEGVAAVSMDRVGREAGVSKALVYVYFPNRLILLQELLRREQQRLVEQQAIEVREAVDFEDLIRRTTRTYLQHVEERGLHIQRLASEPSVAAIFEDLDRKGQKTVAEFLAKEIAATYHVPLRTAELAAEISMGMTGAAGDLIHRGGVDRRTIEDLTICLALGSLHALSATYRRTDGDPVA